MGSRNLTSAQARRTTPNLTNTFCYVMFVWSSGSWSPILVTDWFPPRVSQHMFDPLSLVNILHGIILHLILARFIPLYLGIPLVMFLELLWEYLENTNFFTEKTYGAKANQQVIKESYQ